MSDIESRKSFLRDYGRPVVEAKSLYEVEEEERRRGFRLFLPEPWWVRVWKKLTRAY